MQQAIGSVGSFKGIYKKKPYKTLSRFQQEYGIPDLLAYFDGFSIHSTRSSVEQIQIRTRISPYRLSYTKPVQNNWLVRKYIQTASCVNHVLSYTDYLRNGSLTCDNNLITSTKNEDHLR